MPSASRFALRARIVLPVSRPPIHDGAVFISGNRITAVGPWRELQAQVEGPVTDLGEVILLPGLINAHCHLDYTGMGGAIPQQRSFVDWINWITGFKAEWEYSDFAVSWLGGARMLLRNGVTTVADVEAVPELLPEVWQATPLRVVSFLEMTGVKSRRPPEQILREALATVDSFAGWRNTLGLSPHAPYSTTPELLRRAGAAARERGLPLMTHVAESAEEFEMAMLGRGGMHDWLRRNDRDMADCGGVSPVQQLERTGLLCDRLLAVHANYLTNGDAARLGRSGASVVHCPRSHAFFGHRRFPLEELALAGVNLCLGTDSLATLTAPENPGRSMNFIVQNLLPPNAPSGDGGPRAQRRWTPRGDGTDEVELNLLVEMRAFANAYRALAAEDIVRMVTVNAARALRRGGELGELVPGALADLIALPFDGQVGAAYEACLGHAGAVDGVMIDGRWARGPGAQGSG